jgi:hypothetical protein
MKKILSAIFAILLGCAMHAQDVNEKLNEAQKAYQSGNLEEARFALQEALQGVNQAIGRDILEMLPKSLEGMAVVEGSDIVSGVNVGFAGLFVSRRYEGEATSASIEIMSDSPLIAAVNTFLSLPAIMVSDPNQKRVRVDGYRGMQTRNEYEGNVTYEIQIPVGSTLFSFNVSGFDDEKKVTDMLNSLQVGKIAKIAE